MDDFPILVELFCGFCRSRFFVCCPDFHGQRYCCDDPCRKEGKRLVHKKANARHQQSPEGLADHRDRNREHRALKRLASSAAKKR